MLYMNIHSFIQLFIHPFISMSVLNRSLVPSKLSPPRRTNYYSPFKFTVPSISRKNMQYLLTSSSLPFRHFLLPSIFPSITRFRRQFRRNILPIQLAFISIFCTILMPHSTLCNTSAFLTWSVQLISSNLLQHHISKRSMYVWSTYLSVQFQHNKISAPNSSFYCCRP